MFFLSKCKLSACLVLILSFNTLIFSVISDLLVTDPDAVYIQWITNSSDAMTESNGDDSFAFTSYLGAASTPLSEPAILDAYFGVMCNALTGYDITLAASDLGTTTTGKLTITGGSDLVYSCTLSTISGSFASGASPTTNLDLTGSTVSTSATFAANSDLPLTATGHNTWKISVSLPNISSINDGLLLSGTYNGGITATAVLK